MLLNLRANLDIIFTDTVHLQALCPIQPAVKMSLNTSKNVDM